MRRALRRYREYSLFLEKYSVGEKTAENNNGLNPKKPLSFGKPGAEGVRRECRDPPHCLTSTPGAGTMKFRDNKLEKPDSVDAGMIK